MGISVNGLSSGLDTTQMVKDLMAVEKIPYTNLENKKKGLQTEQGVFRAINTKFKSLEAALNSLKNGADYSQLKATSTGSGVSATAGAGAAAGSYNLNVEKLATADVVRFSSAAVLGEINVPANGKIEIGGYELSAADIKAIKSVGIKDTNNTDGSPDGSPEKQLSKLAEIINRESATSGAKATVLQQTSGTFELMLTSTTTGKNSEVKFAAGGAPITPNSKVDGEDAKFTLNGIAIERSSNEIKDVISGMTFNLTGTGSSTVTVAADTTTLVENMKIFVTAYNDLITLVKDNLSKPEDKDTTNPLQGNSLLKQITNELYNMFNAGVKTGKDGTKDIVSFMQDIGLSIDKNAKSASEMTGKITFNESAFTEALAANPEKVITLLTGANAGGTNTPPNTLVSDAGVFTKLSDIMSQYTSATKGMLTSKITGYDSEIKVVDERMENMDMRLQAKELRLKAQFSNMEVMLSSLKSEQNWLKSQFDSLMPSK